MVEYHKGQFWLPTLFVVYVNDMAGGIKSYTSLFPDVKLLKHVKYTED